MGVTSSGRSKKSSSSRSCDNNQQQLQQPRSGLGGSAVASTRQPHQATGNHFPPVNKPRQAGSNELYYMGEFYG